MDQAKKMGNGEFPLGVSSISLGKLAPRFGGYPGAEPGEEIFFSEDVNRADALAGLLKRR